MTRKTEIAFLGLIIFNAMVLGVNLQAAYLEKKPSSEYGEFHPCTQAIEEIAEVVNERLEE